MSRVLLTGGAGFLGQHVVRQLEARNYEVFIPRSTTYDLRDRYAAGRLLRDSRPDYIIHLAATVGGIGFNRDNPSQCLCDNLAINLNIMKQSLKYASLRKFVAIGSVCAYPSNTPVPFKESSLWDGYPEPTNAPYGLAKRMLLVQCQAYRKQYDFPAIYLLPTNLYGPGDHCDLTNSHVIPALIRKCVEARRDGAESVAVWGTGRATRDFLYVEDCAQGIIAAMQGYDSSEPCNLGTGVETSIARIATMIARHAGYSGELIYDASKPDGQMRRRLDTSRAREFGWQATTELDDGLRRTVAWYEDKWQQEAGV